MNPLTFGAFKLLEIWRENGDERFQLVDEGEWSDEGKFQSQEVVFLDSKTNKYYSFEITRFGSYYNGYDYEILDKAVEVELKEKTITIKEWVVI